MTGGSIYQILKSDSSENNFLEQNPQISFFKVVYRKYTTFSIDNIILETISKSSIQYSSDSSITCDISRDGNLLKQLYLTLELPNIYSGKALNGNFYEFKWIENIGINIFKNIKFRINDQLIENLHSDYINIWKELHLTDDEKNIFNRCIGHEPELYDPKNGSGQNGLYPHAIKGSTNTETANNTEQFFNNNDTSNVITSMNEVDESITMPSIPSKKIKVPLPFFFSHNTGSALPLAALQYSPCNLILEMRKFRDLYTILETDTNNSYVKKRVKPTDEDAYHKISNFTKPSISSDDNINIKLKIEGEYIQLNTEEIRRFCVNSHEYLIEQVKNLDQDGFPVMSSTTNTSLKNIHSLNGPVKYLSWVIKRNDLNRVNIWNNYSNWINDIPPYSRQYINGRKYLQENSLQNNTTIDSIQDKYYDISKNRDIFFSYDGNGHKGKFNYIYLKKNILTNFKLILDGEHTRIDKDIDYFGKQQIQQYFKKDVKNGIYVYSFSLNPLEFQPSGCCNFTNIRTTIELTKEIMEGFGDNFPVGYDYKCYIYAVNYNILVIKSGMGNLKFIS
jgi:hypothetical protein